MRLSRRSRPIPLQSDRRPTDRDGTAARGRPVVQTQEEHVEFLNFVLIFVAAYLLLRRPEKERLAFRLLVVSALLMVALFSIATRTGLLPGINY
jgi:hypothetical protein